jgi:hypothetical protein
MVNCNREKEGEGRSIRLVVVRRRRDALSGGAAIDKVVS